LGCLIYIYKYIFGDARSIARDVDCSTKHLEGVLLYTALSVSCGWFVEVNYFSPVVSLVLYLLKPACPHQFLVLSLRKLF